MLCLTPICCRYEKIMYVIWAQNVIIALVNFRPSAARRTVTNFPWAIITYVMSFNTSITISFHFLFSDWLQERFIFYWLLTLLIPCFIWECRHFRVNFQSEVVFKLMFGATFRQSYPYKSSVSFDFTTKYTYNHTLEGELCLRNILV